MPTSHSYTKMLYGFFIAIGVVGVILSFLKHGTSAHLGFFSYVATSLVALYFFGTARNKQISSSAVHGRLFVLLLLASLPLIVHMFRM